MRLITICGPPSSGKTAVIVHMAKVLRQKGQSLGVVKFDCLATGDDIIYQQHHIPVQVGLSGSLCPDHFFGGNAEICLDWGKDQQFDLLLVESAGLCNRCSPHIQEQYAICVIDNLMGVDAPRKIGPMLKMADAVVVTKGDVAVSYTHLDVYKRQALSVA